MRLGCQYHASALIQAPLIFWGGIGGGRVLGDMVSVELLLRDLPRRPHNASEVGQALEDALLLRLRQGSEGGRAVQALLRVVTLLAEPSFPVRLDGRCRVERERSKRSHAVAEAGNVFNLRPEGQVVLFGCRGQRRCHVCWRVTDVFLLSFAPLDRAETAVVHVIRLGVYGRPTTRLSRDGLHFRHRFALKKPFDEDIELVMLAVGKCNRMVVDR